jgi:hypothetical protein
MPARLRPAHRPGILGALVSRRAQHQARTAKAGQGALRPRRQGAIDELDDRLGCRQGRAHLLDKIFPDHWSFMLGEIALYSFVVLLATGVFLTLYYVPSSAVVVYHGPYLPSTAEGHSGLRLDGQPLVRGARRDS